MDSFTDKDLDGLKKLLHQIEVEVTNEANGFFSFLSATTPDISHPDDFKATISQATAADSTSLKIEGDDHFNNWNHKSNIISNNDPWLNGGNVKPSYRPASQIETSKIEDAMTSCCTTLSDLTIFDCEVDDLLLPYNTRNNTMDTFNLENDAEMVLLNDENFPFSMTEKMVKEEQSTDASALQTTTTESTASTISHQKKPLLTDNYAKHHREWKRQYRARKKLEALGGHLKKEKQ